MKLDAVEDERCQYYLQVLTTMQGAPIIGLGEEVFGFPVVWVGTNGPLVWQCRFEHNNGVAKSVATGAYEETKRSDFSTPQVLEDSSVFLVEKVSQSLDIHTSEETSQSEVLRSALQVLERNQKRLLVFELALEPFLKKEMARCVRCVAARGGIPVSAVVAVVGEGLLADHVCEELSAQYEVVR